jgi:hypothetical protein
MSTTYPIRPITLAYPASGAAGQFGHGPEEASMTFKRGAVLIVDATTREIEESGADPANYLVVGIASADASATAGTDVMFHEAWGNVFMGQLLTDDDDDADDQLAAADRYTPYGMVKDSGTSFWHVDKGDTSNLMVLVTRLVDDVGTNNGRVLFRFTANIMMTNAA